MAYSPYQAPFMAYNASPGINQMQSGYPMSNYQPPVYETPKFQPAAQMTQGNGIIWVQGEAGAKSYLVAPGNTVILWDTESPTIYVKSADSSGMPSMRILDFTERVANAPKISSEHVCECGDRFVKIEDFNTFQERFNALQVKLEELTVKPTAKTTKTTRESTE